LKQPQSIPKIFCDFSKYPPLSSRGCHEDEEHEHLKLDFTISCTFWTIN